MRIGLDLQVLNNQRTGIGNYAFNLARELKKLNTSHEFVLFTPKRITSPTPPHEEGRGGVVELPDRKIPFYDAHMRFAKIIEKQKLDVFHGVANTLPLGFRSPPHPPEYRVPPLPRGERGSERMTRSVITLHDLAIYLHPEWFPRGQWFSTKVLVPRSIKKADRIVVPSQTTKTDLMEIFKVPETKIVVVPHGVEERFFKSKERPLPLSLPMPGEGKSGYILFVGTVEPRKNLQRLIEAYEGLPDEIRDEYELWIAGGKGWGNNLPNPSSRGGARGGRGTIKFLDYVPDEELPALYQNAALFVYPSLYEGFGLPVLEAMAAGVPVVTSKGSAMEEIVNYLSPSEYRSSLPSQGERNNVAGALLVDPYSVEEIRAGIETSLLRSTGTLSPRQERVAGLASPPSRDEANLSDKSGKHYLSPSEYRSSLPSQGERNNVAGALLAREFSWERTARETMRVYEGLGN